MCGGCNLRTAVVIQNDDQLKSFKIRWNRKVKQKIVLIPGGSSVYKYNDWETQSVVNGSFRLEKNDNILFCDRRIII